MTHEMLDLNNRMVVLNDRMIKTNKVVTFLTLIYLPASLMSVRSYNPMPQNIICAHHLIVYFRDELVQIWRRDNWEIQSIWSNLDLRCCYNCLGISYICVMVFMVPQKADIRAYLSLSGAQGISGDQGDVEWYLTSYIWLDMLRSFIWPARLEKGWFERTDRLQFFLSEFRTRCFAFISSHR